LSRKTDLALDFIYSFLHVFDAVGRMVWSKIIGANTSETNIPVNKLSGGLYLLKLTINGSQNEIHKIIVQ